MTSMARETAREPAMEAVEAAAAEAFASVFDLEPVSRDHSELVEDIGIQHPASGMRHPGLAAHIPSREP